MTTDVTTQAKPPRGGQRRTPGGAPPGDGRPRPAGAHGPRAGTGRLARARGPAAGAPAARPRLRPGAPARPAAPGARPQARQPAETARTSRTRFVFLVVGLLGGGLLCLLIINTVLATGSFQITALQQGNVTLSQQVQGLHARIASEESPFSLARRARKLGMVEPGLLHFLNVRTGRVNSGPARMPGIPAVPGYTP